MKNQWFWFVFKRFFFNRNRESAFLPIMSIFFGIALGVFTLFVVMAIMNGSQQNFIGSINEIGSYHLIVSPTEISDGDQEIDLALLDLLRQDQGVKFATPFTDTKTIASNSSGQNAGVFIKGIQPSVLQEDTGLQQYLSAVEGELSLQSTQNSPTILLGVNLANRLGLSPGDTVNLLSLGKQGQLNPRFITFVVNGLIDTKYYEYNNTLAFIDLNNAQRYKLGNNLRYGIKLNNINHDLQVKESLLRRFDAETQKQWHISSWREYNQAFFGALRIEKVTILILISLIFIVVAIHLSHCLSRSLEQRLEDLATLKALGIAGESLRALFLTMVFLLSSLGTTAGLLVGYYFVKYLNGFLLFLENVLFALNLDLGLRTFHTEIIAGDIKYIASIPIICALLAVLKITAPIVSLPPAKVLHYE